jgi:hypothetical protein
MPPFLFLFLFAALGPVGSDRALRFASLVFVSSWLFELDVAQSKDWRVLLCCLLIGDKWLLIVEAFF